MIERTLMRPRDIIAFVNECLREAEGKYEVTGTMIKKAEIEFSRIRREALEQEWQSAFPSIKKLLDFLGSRQKSIISLAEFCVSKEADDLALAIYAEEKIGFDPLYEIAKVYYEQENRTTEQIVKEIIGILYRIGAVGVKLRNGNRYLYSHIDEPLLPLAQITDDARVRIQPMLWGSYRMQ
jgi:hypothetical protein